MSQVKLKINETQFFQKLGHAFASHLSVLRELIQNARRAGSPVVRIQFDELHETLTVEDDGSGISDFQSLLSVAESGWGGEMQEDERPWGTGFLSALYAAQEIKIESNGQMLQARTSDLLSFEAVNVVKVANMPKGTRVTLIGVKLPDLVSKIKEIVAGYPIPVFFNGVELERPHAEGAELKDMRWVSTAIGQVAMRGLEDPDKFSRNAIFYLQGFKVAVTEDYREGPKNVVHLDSKRFTGVYPDRDRVKNEPEMKESYKRMLEEYFRTLVDQAKANMSQTEFLKKYWGLIKRLDYEKVINDLDVVPGDRFAHADSYPYVDSDAGTTFYCETVKDVLTREELEQAVVLDLDAYDNDDEDAKRMLWMLAYGKRWLIYEGNGLDKGHWLFGLPNYHHEDQLEDFDLTIKIDGAGQSTRVSGSWLYSELTLCESYTIQSTLGEHTFDKDGIDLLETGILIPALEESGYVVRQTNSYISDDRFQEADRDADEALVETTIRRLRMTNPADLVLSTIDQTDLLKFEQCRDKTFFVEIRTVDDVTRVKTAMIDMAGVTELPAAALEEINQAVQAIRARYSN